MINCKKTIIATCFTLLLPLTAWSEAIIVDDSDNFAINESQQTHASVGNSKYDEPLIDSAEIDQNDGYYQNDDGPALVKEDRSQSSGNMNDNAKLIDKIQGLQQEIQELRGQLEVQAHDLKLLQQQQVAFYKDLDSRLGSAANTNSQGKAPTELSLGSNPSTAAPVAVQTSKTSNVTPVIAPVSRVNPADEQISYLAAYELVKNKKYDDAVRAMQTFVQKYPSGGYTANAEYWLGELYLAKKEYPKALEHFELVLQKFPSSSKSAASLLKTGYVYTATGNKQEAKRRLQQVIRTYPGTPTAQLANSKLATIN